MTVAVKPWTELTDLERREAIARRLGWTDPVKGLWKIGPMESNGRWSHQAYSRLKDWPTNDGLAFADVWPLLVAFTIHHLQAICQLTAMSRDLEYDHHGFEATVEFGREPNETHRIFYGTTWADVICRAAYELLPEVAS